MKFTARIALVVLVILLVALVARRAFCWQGGPWSQDVYGSITAWTKWASGPWSRPASTPTPTPAVVLNMPLTSDLVDTITSVAADLTRNNEATYVACADSLVYTVGSNLPRFGCYTGDVTGLTLEAAATNEVPTSDSILAPGTAINVSTFYDEVDTPFPGKTSGIIRDNVTNYVHLRFGFAFAATAGERYIVSVFVKDIDHGFFSVGVLFSNGGPAISLPTLTISADGATGTIVDPLAVQDPDYWNQEALGNDWYRISVGGVMPAGVAAGVPFVGLPLNATGGVIYAGAGESIRYFGLDARIDSPFIGNYISAITPTTSAEETLSIPISADLEASIIAAGTAVMEFSLSSDSNILDDFYVNLFNQDDLGNLGLLGVRVTSGSVFITAQSGAVAATVNVLPVVGGLPDLQYNERCKAAVQWDNSATHFRVGFRKNGGNWTFGSWATVASPIFAINAGKLLHIGGGEPGTDTLSLSGIEGATIKNEVVSDMDATYPAP